ncbi:hypothetical protein WOA01_00180 [Methylocystis sp. IM2]|uniref:hypothetical protein n=1 Tax=unclassified Methylocystis TaxID=2625913 RepID=UPI0030F52E73
MSATKKAMKISAIAAVSSLVMTQYLAKPVLVVTAMPMVKRELKEKKSCAWKPPGKIQ